MITVKWSNWNELINDIFIPLIHNKDRYLILYGSRGSSKSSFVVRKLLFRCLTEKYFRYIIIRNTYNTIAGSQFKDLQDTIIQLGLSELFKFTVSPFAIKCVNGNEFIARGCDEPAKLKSLKDPTGVWWEEDIPDENDFKIITKTIRTTRADYLQEIFSINPEVVGDYKENWFYKKFFAGNYPEKKTFRNTDTFEIGKEFVTLSYTCHHSTINDNKWSSNEYKALLKSEKDSHRYNIDWLGLWSTKITGGNIYKYFNAEKHTRICKYDPDLPLHLSWDENKNPYLPCVVFQIEGKEIRLIRTILGRNPFNTVRANCNEIKRIYANHREGMFIYGDATSRAADIQKSDVKGEEGYDMFDSIMRNLSIYRPSLRVNNSNPNVNPRIDFFNSVLESNEGGLSFMIDKDCIEAIADFEQTKEDVNGRKAKITIKDADTGISYQPFGHITDCADYLLCTAFPTEYAKSQRGTSLSSGYVTNQNYLDSGNRY